MGRFEKRLRILKDCAFCGGKPKLARCGDQKEYFVYRCSICYETPVMFHEARMCEFSARKTWNERTEAARYILNVYSWVKSHATKTLQQGDSK